LATTRRVLADPSTGLGWLIRARSMLFWLRRNGQKFLKISCHFRQGRAGDESSIKQETPVGNPANFENCLDALKFVGRPEPAFLKFQKRTLA
jgi:hypothetical protein